VCAGGYDAHRAFKDLSLKRRFDPVDRRLDIAHLLCSIELKENFNVYVAPGMAGTDAVERMVIIKKYRKFPDDYDLEFLIQRLVEKIR